MLIITLLQLMNSITAALPCISAAQRARLVMHKCGPRPQRIQVLSCLTNDKNEYQSNLIHLERHNLCRNSTIQQLQGPSAPPSKGTTYGQLKRSKLLGRTKSIISESKLPQNHNSSFRLINNLEHQSYEYYRIFV